MTARRQAVRLPAALFALSSVSCRSGLHYNLSNLIFVSPFHTVSWLPRGQDTRDNLVEYHTTKAPSTVGNHCQTP